MKHSGKVLSRRAFLKDSSLAGILIAGQPAEYLIDATNFEEHLKKEKLLFLFQGDSITDGNRGRNNDPNHIMGHGYAFSIASSAGAMFPTQQLSFINRGVSGNKITDLVLRWEQDALQLKPDVLSILIGVNDADAAIKKRDAATAEDYEKTFRSILEDTRKRLPGCLLVLCEPFILPVSRVKENWTEWSNEIRKRQDAVKRLAKEFKTIFVPLQKVFSDAAGRPSAEYWIWDGIHPTVAGHELITREWLKQVGKQLHFLKKII